VLCALAGCRLGPDKDLSAKKPYADLIGTEYSVVSDELRAYGVYESLNNRTRSFVDLVPLPLGGPEFAFKRPVPKGQIIRILGASQQASPVRTGIYYLVELENWDLPKGVPVRLELSRGNEGVGADLNPSIYRKLPKNN
jgi:hypothetical protein